MATWAELNQAAGGQAITPAPSVAQTGGWAAANAQAVQSLGASGSPSGSGIPQSTTPGGIQLIPGSTISAPAPSTKKLSFKGISINRPGGPLIDIDPSRFEAVTTEKAGFIRKGVAAAVNVAGSSLLGLSQSFGSAFDLMIVDTQSRREQKAGIEPSASLLPDIRKRAEQGLPAIPTTAEKVGAGLNILSGGAGVAFAPVAAQLEAAKELPVIGKPVFGTVSKGFELLDHASRFVGGKVVDILPVDDQSKAVLRQPIEDLAGIVGTLFGVKAIHVAGQKGGGRVVDALPVTPKTKGQIRAGVQLGAGIALEPFTLAYRGIVSSVKTKTEARQSRGQEITPDIARRIVNETVKEVRTPDIQAIMAVPTKSGPTRVYTNQKLVLENLVRGRENLNYKRVDDLGISLKTKEPITSRFEWDYAKQQGTIYTTKKTTAVDLARELGHYVDRQLGASLSTRLSEALPDYHANREQINQMLADYALDRLGGDAKHTEINAEILKVAENIQSEIKTSAEKTERQRPAKEFAEAVGDVISDPLKRKASPELAQLIDFSVGKEVTKKGKPDVEGSETVILREKPRGEEVAGRVPEKTEVKEKVKPADPLILEAREYETAAKFIDAKFPEGVKILERGKYRKIWKEAHKTELSEAKANRLTQRAKREAAREAAKEITDKAIEKDVLNSLNPTGGLFVDYKPAERVTLPLGKNMITLADSTGKSPNEMVTIYRGAPKNQKSINPGDFVTTSRELAESYTGEGNILKKEVRKGDVLDDKTSPLGEEYIYRPNADKELSKAEAPKVEPKQAEPAIAPRRGVSKVGESIARKTIEQKLEDSYGETAGFERINIKDQAKRVEELINTDLERAKRVMTGEEGLPDGMRAGALIKGIEEYALRTGDAELAFELANSRIISETSIHAQEMRLLAERSPDSATARLQSVKKARIEAAEKALSRGETLNDTIRKTKKEIKEAVEKSRPKKEDWSSFIDKLKC